MLKGRLANGRIGAAHHQAQALINLLLSPGERLHGLDPLEVGNRDAACVQVDVGYYQDAFVEQDGIGIGGDGPVGGFANDFGLDAGRVVLRDLAFEGGRNEDVAVQNQGIGRLLLNFTEAEVDLLKGRLLIIETSARTHYSATQNFYLRNGYTIAAQIKDFYAPGDDRMIFVKYFRS